jgi:hypothetical protein
MGEAFSMKRIYLFLLFGIAGCGPAFAQVSVSVSPALGLEDFRRPITCIRGNLCAATSPALGLAHDWQSDLAPVRRAPRLSAALLPGPTPRPEPTPEVIEMMPLEMKGISGVSVSLLR